MATQGFSKFRFGAIGGGNFTTFRSGVDTGVILGSDAYTGHLGPSGSFGYMFGGQARYDQEKWSFEVDLLYTNRTMKWHGTLEGTDTIGASHTITLKQLELPMIGFYKVPIDNFDFRFGIGLFATYGMGKIKDVQRYQDSAGNELVVTLNESWKEFGFKQINMGGLLDFGTDLKLEGGSKIGLDLRAQTSFTGYQDKVNPNLSGDKFSIMSIDLLASYLF